MSTPPPSGAGSDPGRETVRPAGPAETVADPRFGEIPPTARPTAGGQQRFGKYRVLRELGRGGMGVVYEAHEESLARTVALKVLSGGAEVTREERERFLREARICAQLSHPGIVAVHHVDEAGDPPYFSMELVRGGSLSDWMRARPLEIREAAEVIRAVADAVAHAHAHGVVHRDLKPQNVLCDWPAGAPPVQVAGRRPELPRLMVGDFGLGKVMGTESTGALTVTGTVLGTPMYMPPEQAAGKTREISPASDVYSLGAMLYELVTGAPPFSGATPYEVVAKVLRDYPRAPRSLNGRLSRDLETIVVKAMEKDPRRRYPTARELRDDLDRFLRGEAIQARTVGLWGRAWRLARRDPRAAVLLALAVLAPAGVAIALFFVVLSYREAHDRSARPFWEAVRATAEGRPMADAREAFRRALAIDPDNWDSSAGLADLELEEGRYGAALERLERTRDSAPYVPWPRTASGLALLELGRPERAAEMLRTLPAGERDGPIRWAAQAVATWLGSADLRPPARGFRYPPRARTPADPAPPARRLRESPCWAPLELAFRLRETYLLGLLMMRALALDGERDAAREILRRLERTHPRRPAILAWSAWFGERAWTEALAEADRPELRLLAADAAETAGDAAGALEHRRRAAADASAREQAATDADEAAYWSDLRAEAGK